MEAEKLIVGYIWKYYRAHGQPQKYIPISRIVFNKADGIKYC